MQLKGRVSLTPRALRAGHSRQRPSSSGTWHSPSACVLIRSFSRCFQGPAEVLVAQGGRVGALVWEVARGTPPVSAREITPLCRLFTLKLLK